MNGNIFTKMSHSRLGEASNFGYPLGFRKNHAVTNSIEVQNTRVKLPSLRNQKSCMGLKPMLPKESPLSGIGSNCNFVSDNMDVARSLSRKKKLIERVRSSGDLKRDFAKVP